jgi:hypothetical protein
MMDGNFRSDSAVWNPAQFYYQMQFQYINEVCDSCATFEFEQAFKGFHKLFVFVSPNLKKELLEEIQVFLIEVKRGVVRRTRANPTKQSLLELETYKATQVNKFFTYTMQIMAELKRVGMLNWVHIKDDRTIAERNNK